MRFRTQYRSNRDHPRRCGENKGQGIRWLIFVGSPPQVRGKLPEFGGNATIDRITPAGAGKTAAQSLPEPTWRDHPRRCGENQMRIQPCGLYRGSPPQVRGKRTYAVKFALDYGITPAGAGKTMLVWRPCRRDGDHPRRCGENATEAADRPESWRITPAGAGKTPTTLFASVSVKDHPRRCGENENIPFKEHTSIGSPPQVRGKPFPAGS